MSYWVVGAMWRGKSENDVLPNFLKRGYWYCWDEKYTPQEEESKGSGNSVEAQRERFTKIKISDRIAVKKNLSITNQEIEIRAIGIVKDIDLNEWRVYVDWLPSFKEKRVVNMKGCSASVHGPYENDSAWVKEIFCI